MPDRRADCGCFVSHGVHYAISPRSFKVNLGQLKVNPGLTWGNTTIRGLTALWANQPPGAAVLAK